MRVYVCGCVCVRERNTKNNSSEINIMTWPYNNHYICYIDVIGSPRWNNSKWQYAMTGVSFCLWHRCLHTGMGMRARIFVVSQFIRRALQQASWWRGNNFLSLCISLFHPIDCHPHIVCLSFDLDGGRVAVHCAQSRKSQSTGVNQARVGGISHI